MSKPNLTNYTDERLAEYHRFCCASSLNFSTCTQAGRVGWRRERNRVEAEINRRQAAA